MTCPKTADELKIARTTVAVNWSERLRVKVGIYSDTGKYDRPCRRFVSAYVGWALSSDVVSQLGAKDGRTKLQKRAFLRKVSWGGMNLGRR